jgi:hypothetical protein
MKIGRFPRVPTIDHKTPTLPVGVFLCAAMGRLARGDPDAGWQACKRQTVLGADDHKGDRDNLDTRRILLWPIMNLCYFSAILADSVRG